METFPAFLSHMLFLVTGLVLSCYDILCSIEVRCTGCFLGPVYLPVYQVVMYAFVYFDFS